MTIQTNVQPSSGFNNVRGEGVGDGAIKTMAELLDRGVIRQSTVDSYGGDVANRVQQAVLGLRR